MKLLRLGTLAFTTTLAVLVPSAVQADSYVRPDAARDVHSYDQSFNEATAPDRAEGDILSSGVVHGRRRVAMAMRFAQLIHSGHGATYTFLIGTKHMRRYLFLDTSPGHWRGLKLFSNGGAHPEKCRGIGWSIDYRANLVRASVPRRCLRRPKWVHVGMGANSWLNDQVFFLDDAAANDYIGREWKYGPRVYR